MKNKNNIPKTANSGLRQAFSIVLCIFLITTPITTKISKTKKLLEVDAPAQKQNNPNPQKRANSEKVKISETPKKNLSRENQRSLGLSTEKKGSPSERKLGLAKKEYGREEITWFMDALVDNPQAEMKSLNESDYELGENYFPMWKKMHEAGQEPDNQESIKFETGLKQNDMELIWHMRVWNHVMQQLKFSKQKSLCLVIRQHMNALPVYQPTETGWLSLLKSSKGKKTKMFRGLAIRLAKEIALVLRNPNYDQTQAEHPFREFLNYPQINSMTLEDLGMEDENLEEVKKHYKKLGLQIGVAVDELTKAKEDYFQMFLENTIENDLDRGMRIEDFEKQMKELAKLREQKNSLFGKIEEIKLNAEFKKKDLAVLAANLEDAMENQDFIIESDDIIDKEDENKSEKDDKLKNKYQKLEDNSYETDSYEIDQGGGYFKYYKGKKRRSVTKEVLNNRMHLFMKGMTYEGLITQLKQFESDRDTIKNTENVRQLMTIDLRVFLTSKEGLFHFFRVMLLKKFLYLLEVFDNQKVLMESFALYSLDGVAKGSLDDALRSRIKKVRKKINSAIKVVLDKADAEREAVAEFYTTFIDLYDNWMKDQSLITSYSEAYTEYYNLRWSLHEKVLEMVDLQEKIKNFDQARVLQKGGVNDSQNLIVRPEFLEEVSERYQQLFRVLNVLGGRPRLEDQYHPLLLEAEINDRKPPKFDQESLKESEVGMGLDGLFRFHVEQFTEPYKYTNSGDDSETKTRSGSYATMKVIDKQNKDDSLWNLMTETRDLMTDMIEVLKKKFNETKTQLIKLMLIQKWEKRLDYELGRFIGMSQIIYRRHIKFEKLSEIIKQKKKDLAVLNPLAESQDVQNYKVTASENDEVVGDNGRLYDYFDDEANLQTDDVYKTDKYEDLLGILLNEEETNTFYQLTQKERKIRRQEKIIQNMLSTELTDESFHSVPPISMDEQQQLIRKSQTTVSQHTSTNSSDLRREREKLNKHIEERISTLGTVITREVSKNLTFQNPSLHPSQNPSHVSQSSIHDLTVTTKQRQSTLSGSDESTHSTHDSAPTIERQRLHSDLPDQFQSVPPFMQQHQQHLDEINLPKQDPNAITMGDIHNYIIYNLEVNNPDILTVSQKKVIIQIALDHDEDVSQGVDRLAYVSRYTKSIQKENMEGTKQVYPRNEFEYMFRRMNLYLKKEQIKLGQFLSEDDVPEVGNKCFIDSKLHYHVFNMIKTNVILHENQFLNGLVSTLETAKPQAGLEFMLLNYGLFASSKMSETEAEKFADLEPSSDEYREKFEEALGRFQTNYSVMATAYKDLTEYSWSSDKTGKVKDIFIRLVNKIKTTVMEKIKAQPTLKRDQLIATWKDKVVDIVTEVIADVLSFMLFVPFLRKGIKMLLNYIFKKIIIYVLTKLELGFAKAKDFYKEFQNKRYMGKKAYLANLDYEMLIDENLNDIYDKKDTKEDIKKEIADMEKIFHENAFQEVSIFNQMHRDEIYEPLGKRAQIVNFVSWHGSDYFSFDPKGTLKLEDMSKVYKGAKAVTVDEENRDIQIGRKAQPNSHHYRKRKIRRIRRLEQIERQLNDTKKNAEYHRLGRIENEFDN